MKNMMKRLGMLVMIMLCTVLFANTIVCHAEEKEVKLTPAQVEDIVNSPTALLDFAPSTDDQNYKYIYEFTLTEKSKVRITSMSRYAYWNWGGETKLTLADSKSEFSTTYSQAWSTGVNADHSWSEKAGNFSDKYFDLDKGTYYIIVNTKLSDNFRTDKFANNDIYYYKDVLGFYLSVNVAPMPHHKITYDLKGGVNSKSNPEQYQEGNYVVFKAPKKAGYLFVGWYKDASFKEEIKEIATTDITDFNLYAKWTKVKIPARATITTVSRKTRLKMDLQYKAIKNIKKYEIQYSTTKNFTKATTKTISSSRTKVSFSGLKKGIYYVRVRAYNLDSYNKKVYGKWSTVKVVK